MGLPNSEILSVIFYLLPGFVAAWIFHGLTAHRKPSPFERIVQALIFTALVQSVIFPVGRIVVWIGSWMTDPLGDWNENTALVVSVLVAVLFGFIFSYFANNSKFHNVLPKWITKRTSFPSEWFSAFNKDERFVYLHLDDNRRIYGWPSEWPDHPDEGHIVLMKPEWILDDNQPAPLYLTERMLIPANKVVMVEFEKFENECTHSEEDRENVERLLVNLQKKPIQEENDGREEAGEQERVGIAERPTASSPQRERTVDEQPAARPNGAAC